MTRWSLMSLMLLALCTACPETWRKGGRIDRALSKELGTEWRERQRPPQCLLSAEEWEEQCEDGEEDESPDVCHPECGP